jgi:hypothetical protein
MFVMFYAVNFLSSADSPRCRTTVVLFVFVATFADAPSIRISASRPTIEAGIYEHFDGDEAVVSNRTLIASNSEWSSHGHCFCLHITAL